MTEGWEMIRENTVVVATIVLAVATMVLAWHTAGLRKSTKRQMEQTIWQGDEDHFQRMIAQVQEAPSAVQRHATWELTQIAEEWGEGRRRAAIVAVFTKLGAEEEERRKLPGWEEALSTRAILARWERDGIDYNRRREGDGVDGTRERRATLRQRLWWTTKTWWNEGREAVPEVTKTKIEEGVVAMQAEMRSTEYRMRATGGVVYAQELGWAKPHEAPRLRRMGEADWDSMEEKVHGGTWTSVIGSTAEPETARPGVKVQTTGTWSATKPHGEWQVKVEVRAGTGVNTKVWEWRGDAPKWVEGTEAARREIRSATAAAIERWQNDRKQ